MNRTEVFKETIDNWCPNYHGTLVRVTYHGDIEAWRKGVPCYRVSVWGNDDIGMEYDTEDEKEALAVFMHVIGYPYVNMINLKQLGFVPA